MSADAATEEKTVEVGEKAGEDDDVSSVASSAPNAPFPLQAPSQQAQRQNILAPDGGPNDDGK